MSKAPIPLNIPPNITIAFFGLLAAGTVIAPRISIGTYFGCVVLAAIYLLRTHTSLRPGHGFTLVEMALLSIVGYCAINASWAVDLGEAYEKAALLGAIIIGCFITLRMIETGRECDLRAVAAGLIIGVVIGSVFLVVEIYTNQAILRSIYTHAPWSRPDIKHITIQNGIVTSIFFSDLNRGIATLTLALWPTLFLMRYLLGRGRGFAMGFIFLLLSSLAIWGSTHESSKAGFVASMLIFGLAVVCLRVAHRLVTGAWIAAYALVVPLSLFVFSQGIQKAEWLQPSAQHRLFIWYETAKMTLDRPVLGIGVRSTKKLDKQAKEERSITRLDGEAFPRHISRHSHNAYLQIWLELGAIGALLCGFCGYAILRKASSQITPSQKYILATFVVFASIAAFSWGIWQEWYQCAVALSVVVLALCGRFRRDGSLTAS